jgi:hypothetical protein
MRAFVVALALLASIVFGCAPPALAQFNQGQTITSAGGTANAQTGTLANALSLADLVNVPLYYVPSVTNTSDTTLQINGFASPPHFNKPNGAGTGVLVGGELIANQPIVLQYDGTAFQLIGNVTLPIHSGNLDNSSQSYGPAVNLQIVASVGSNNLTIALKTGSSGAVSPLDPTASRPIMIAFRDSTIANGDPLVRSITAALSFTITSGSTMGCSSAVMCRLWIFAIDNAGTVALCAYNANSGGTSIIGLSESVLQTSASGTTGGSSAQTLYCSTSAVTAKAVRYLGYVDVQEATAGTWATLPTLVQLFGPGIRKPGEVVQVLFSLTTSPTTLTGSLTQTAVLQAISLNSAANLVKVHATVAVVATTTQTAIIKLSRGSGPTGVGSAQDVATGAAGTALFSVSLDALDQPNTTSSTTYYVYGSCTVSTDCSTNGQAGTSSYIETWEIMGAIEPANDNGSPLSMVG